MLIEENEKKRQAQLANTAPVVHAPPVVQPVVVQGGYGAPQGTVVQGGYAPQPGYAPQGQVVGSYPPAGQVYAPQGTVVQGGYAPEGGYARES